ncbi:putative FAD dependent oxidoreductase [Terfezia boudieri ATCC MYA-4762]|uniref:Putative FAD dependent oxidoreductase n=1 Tax=Terfezia boudieri ATCC MYA-4762 TaxID=1051890 RepID=A0A3N4LFB8_9PEZI|nr:putative FAD dependent oxidoreductase [Terfezia boudieri ATCC MYA-4762]
MRSIYFQATGLLLQLACSTALVPRDNPSHNLAQHSNTITRDVAIIGGGSTGTFAAIKLLDQGHTVVVVEAKDRLGGHTETYHDPLTGTPIEMGVVVFHDLDIVKDYFARFNIALTKVDLFSSNTTYVNLATGQLAKGYVPPTPQALGAAIQNYAALLDRYSYIEGGFNLPYPVPQELVIPFGEFVEKHSLQALVQSVFMISQGLGDILNVPTIYVLQNFGLDVIRFAFLATGDNSQIYEKATAELAEKKSVLLNSYVLSADRNKRDQDGYLSVTVKTGKSPHHTVIRAKQILITIPPTMEKLAPFNLDTTEKSIFGKFKWVAYITGILKNVGIPLGTNLNNVNPANSYSLPKLPAPYGFFDTGVSGLTHVKYVSTSFINEKAAKKDILDALSRLKDNEVIACVKEGPEFVAYSDHSPFEMKVDRADIEGGFYERMYGLQGKRGTWWTGAAWLTQDSTLLWRFTEGVLARLVKEL